jgi:hypothetical protein
MQSNIHTLNHNTPSSMLSFSASELEIMLEVARHWMKLRACHEIDNDLIMGAFFYQSWNPRATILKIEKQGVTIGKIKRSGWALMPLRLVSDFDPLALGDDPLSKVEIVQLSEMMTAAVSGGLKRFLMNGAVMQEVEGAKVSVYWSTVKPAKAVAEKLALAAYEIEQEQVMKFNEANYA